MNLRDQDNGMIFVVDDNEDIRKSLSNVLRLNGYQVSTFDSGEKFLDNISNSAVGCALLDVRLNGGISGIDVLKQLVARSIRMPVIMLSGAANIPDCVEAVKIGAFDFIEKPFRSNRLIEAIKKAEAEFKVEESADAQTKQLQKCVDSLTDDEQSVLERLLKGDVQQKIADDLGVSLRTVQFRLKSSREKFDVDSQNLLIQSLTKANELGIFPVQKT